MDLLVLSSEADVEAVAEYLSVEAGDSRDVSAAARRTYGNIIAGHLPPGPRANPLVEVKRGSWYHVTSKWRELLGDLGADDSDLIGQVVPLLAALDEDGGPLCF